MDDECDHAFEKWLHESGNWGKFGSDETFVAMGFEAGMRAASKQVWIIERADKYESWLVAVADSLESAVACAKQDGENYSWRELKETRHGWELPFTDPDSPQPDTCYAFTLYDIESLDR